MSFNCSNITKNAVKNDNTKANIAPLTPNPRLTSNTANPILPKPSIETFNPSFLKDCSPCKTPLVTGNNKESIIIKLSISNGVIVSKFKNFDIHGLASAKNKDIIIPYRNNFFSDLNNKYFIFPYSFFILNSETNLVMLICMALNGTSIIYNKENSEPIML